MIKQRGDTIVEVLLAMAVVGMVLASSFGIANRSLNIGRSAQERTQALKIAESQLELMKLAEQSTSGVVSGRAGSFCIKVSPGSIAPVDESDNACKDTDGSGGSGLYTISINSSGSGASKVYEIKILWERLGASNNNLADRQDTLSLFYKLGTI